MSSFIFIIAVGILGFLFGDGAFGSKLINAFEYLNVLYWVVFSIAVIIIGVLFAGLVGFAGKKYKLSGIIGGSVLGVFLSFTILLVPVIQLILIHNILLGIDPNAIGFETIGDKTYIYLWLLIIILSSNIISFKGKE
jgi:hypothetical protein